MQKKILAVLLILSMLLTFAACGGGAGNGGANDGGETQANQVDTDNKTETPKSNRDKAFNLENDYASCVLEYDSSYCDTVDYAVSDETDSLYVSSQGGQAVVNLITCYSVDDHIHHFKKEKNAGNNSYYYVKDLVVEKLHSCEVNGYTYETYSYSYKDVYVSQNQEYDNYGMFGYVQLDETNALLIEECSYEDLQTFVESALYIKEVTSK